MDLRISLKKHWVLPASAQSLIACRWKTTAFIHVTFILTSEGFIHSFIHSLIHPIGKSIQAEKLCWSLPANIFVKLWA